MCDLPLVHTPDSELKFTYIRISDCHAIHFIILRSVWRRQKPDIKFLDVYESSCLIRLSNFWNI